jgi:hypothetical protein
MFICPPKIKWTKVQPQGPTVSLRTNSGCLCIGCRLLLHNTGPEAAQLLPPSFHPGFHPGAPNKSLASTGILHRTYPNQVYTSSQSPPYISIYIYIEALQRFSDTRHTLRRR